MTNPVMGIIAVTINSDLESGDEIHLSFETSPQETSLVNIEGDNDDFDLLLVENPAGPYGDYSGQVIVAESVKIKLDGRDMDGGIHDEQHAVPADLQTNLEVDDEEVVARFWDYDDATDSTERISNRLGCQIGDDSPHPIASPNTDGDRNPNDRCDTPETIRRDNNNALLTVDHDNDDNTAEIDLLEFPAGVDQGKIPGVSGTGTGNADTIASTFTAAVGTTPASRTGKAGTVAERTFYIQVANPPIRANHRKGLGDHY